MESKKIKKGDFVEIDYTGTVSDDKQVFDTTKKEVAMANNLSHKEDFKPVVICVGESHILPALDAEIEGKTAGNYKFDLEPEKAFGKKSAQLLKLIPMNVFKKQDIQPFPGLEVNIDNNFGIIRTVSGGRVIVDFNHPLSGKNISYDVEVKGLVTDKKRQLESILQMNGVHINSTSIKDGNAIIVLEHEIPEEVKKALNEQLKKLVGISKANYVVKKQEKQ